MSAPTLSPRQAEVLDLVLAGWPTARIADRLAVSPKTVECHTAAILRAHGCRTRLELVAVLWSARCARLERLVS